MPQRRLELKTRMSFNADFYCNLTIPNNAGIGKNASIGFGVIHLDKETKQSEVE
jgi:hypothetical protein